jgi:hypothetical protein
MKILLFVLLLTVSMHLDALPNQRLTKDTIGPWVVKVYYDDIQQLGDYAKTSEPWSIHPKHTHFTVFKDNMHQYQTLIKVVVNLGSFAKSPACIRWKFDSGLSVDAGAWEIDDIRILDPVSCISASSHVIFIQGIKLND